jgi:hypothetical protein
LKKFVLLLLAAMVVVVACSTRHRTPIAPTETILFAGDSIMAGMGPAIQKLMQTGRLRAPDGFLLREHALHYRYVQEGKVSSGLCRPDFYNWPARLHGFTARYHPKLILICIGTNDTQHIRTGHGVLEFRSHAWEREYRRRILTLIGIAKDAGAEVVFVSPPIMGREKLRTGVEYVNGIIRKTCVQDHVLFIDLWHHLADGSGKYQRYWHNSPEIYPVPLRAADGVHVAPEGNRLLAEAVVKTLLKKGILPLTLKGSL